MMFARRFSILALLASVGLALFAVGSQAHAQAPTIWLPTGPGDFMLNENWSDNVPQMEGWGNTSFFAINSGGEAQLSVSHEVSSGQLGQTSGQSGILTLQTGSNLILKRNDLENDVYGTVYVGVAGQGTLNLSGGTLTSVDLRVASASGGTGSVNFSGGALNLSGVLYLGDGGTGTLTQTVGVLTAANAIVGASGTGTLTATGGQLDITNLTVGGAGQGTLTVSGPATLQTATTIIGNDAGSNGTATLSGTTWTNSGNLTVGSAGSGTLTVEDGASLTVDGSLTLTGASGGSGTLALNASTLDVGMVLTIGQSGNGTATIANGSTLTADAIIVSGESPAPASSLTVTDSTIIAGQIAGLSNGSASFTDSTIRATQDNTAYFLGLEEVRVEGASLTFETQQYQIATSSALLGTARLIKTGTGSLGLLGTSYYSGGTYLQQGEIVINNANSLGAGALEMDTGEIRSTATATLAINDVTVNADQAATFSTAASTTLTLDFEILRLGDDSILRFGSTGNTGAILFGADIVEANTGGTGILSLEYGTLTATDSALGTIASRVGKVFVKDGAILDFNDQSTDIDIGILEGDGIITTGDSAQTSVTVRSGDFGGQFLTSGSITKEGPGTLTFSGTPQVSGGIIVNAGTLLLNGPASADVFISGGTLGGTGSATIVTIDGGTFSPGEIGEAGTFTTEILVWVDGDIAFDLGATPATSDLITLTDELYGQGTTYSFLFTLAPGAVLNTTYTLMTFGTQNIAITDFAIANTDGLDGTFAYNGSALEFTLTAIPEPGTATLLGLALLPLLARRRTRIG